jgi:hypothetical protein
MKVSPLRRVCKTSNVCARRADRPASVLAKSDRRSAVRPYESHAHGSLPHLQTRPMRRVMHSDWHRSACGGCAARGPVHRSSVPTYDRNRAPDREHRWEPEALWCATSGRTHASTSPWLRRSGMRSMLVRPYAHRGGRPERGRDDAGTDTLSNRGTRGGKDDGALAIRLGGVIPAGRGGRGRARLPRSRARCGS